LLIRYDELWDEANALRNGLTFETLRLKNVERNLKVFEGTSWSPTWATAVAGEVGEACNFIKKRRRGEEVATNDIGKELADAVIYLDLLAWNLGLDLGKAVTDKFNEVSERRGTTIRIEPTLEPVATTKPKARLIP
jgi:NTP pyrophosphatase (non-canonical NTP hydrolase)